MRLHRSSGSVLALLLLLILASMASTSVSSARVKSVRLGDGNRSGGGSLDGPAADVAFLQQRAALHAASKHRIPSRMRQLHRQRSAPSSSESGSDSDSESFAARSARHNRENNAEAKAHAGKYAAYIHSPGTRIDFGCGRARCHCPLPLSASFSSLRVEGYRLRSEQRLMESAACFAQAMDLYLSRAGRYYVRKGGDGGYSGDSTGDLSIKPNPNAPSGPVSLPSIGHDRESLEAAAARGLSPSEAAAAHAAAQALIDKLNRGPEAGWSVRQRRKAPEVERLGELAKASDLAKVSLDHIEQQEAHEGEGDAGDDSSTSSSSSSPSERHVWVAPSLSSASEQQHAHDVARAYEQQLRQQWKDWGTQEGAATAAAIAAKKK